MEKTKKDEKKESKDKKVKKEDKEKKEKKSEKTGGGDGSSAATTALAAGDEKKAKKSSTTKEKTKKTSKKEDRDKKESVPKTPEEALKSEYRRWKKKHTGGIGIEWVSLDTDELHLSLRFSDGTPFSVSYPESFPRAKDEPFFIISSADNMDSWNDSMQEVTEKQISLSKILEKCVECYDSIKGTGGGSGGGGGGYDFGEYGGEFDEDGFGFKEEKSEKKSYDAVDAQFADKKFLEIGSPAASLRLIKDLKNIKRVDPLSLGFTAEPRVEPGKNIENLYHWIVKLHFDGDLGRDLVESKKKFGIDVVELEMRFSEHYPFRPPFVRVIRPRFQFHTGHVTIGGSICMELLTNSGWRSTNDIESILIQIRSEMQEGKARLDLGSSGQYSESEAWDAYYRAAKSHGWDIKDIGPTMFPTIK